MVVADSVRVLIPRLIAGDVDTVVECFGEKATVEAPRSGPQEPPEWAASERGWLSAGNVTSHEVNTVMIESRVAHELVVTLSEDGNVRHVPVLLVAEADADGIRTLYEFYSPASVGGRPAEA